MNLPTIVRPDRVAAACRGYYVRDGVLHGPKVTYKPIPEAATQPKITPRSVILHSEAGPRYTPLQNLWNYIRRADITGEPHFLVDRDGTVWQAMPVTVRADNNYRANRWIHDGRAYGAVSFETSDEGWPTLDRTPWNAAQLAAIVGATAALCCTYGIACTAPARWTDSGIGHHVLFPNDWTNVRGKTCPGRARIAQMDWIRREVAVMVAAYHQSNGTTCPAT